MKRWLFIVVGMLLLALQAQAAELGKTLVPLDASKVAVEETAFGDFVADAARHAVTADIAILHAMAFRSTAQIPAGVVDEQMIRGALAQPSSKITILKLTPAQLRAFMERSLSRVPDFNMAFLQFSGMQVTFDGAKPEQNRVVSITVGDKKLDLTDNKTEFKVAMPRELASGAVGYLRILPKSVIDAMQVTETTLLDAVAKEFAAAKNREITPKVDERLKNLNSPKKPAQN
jgi:hypothetical protein